MNVTVGTTYVLPKITHRSVNVVLWLAVSWDCARARQSKLSKLKLGQKTDEIKLKRMD